MATPETVIFRIVADPDVSPDGDPAALMAALSDFAPVLDVMARDLQEAQRENFASQGAAFGAPWAGWAESTARERFRAGFGPNQLLIRSGLLESAIGQSVVLSGDSVTVGIDLAEVPYAARLNAGDQSRNLPARVLVAVTEDMIEGLLARLKAFIAERSGGQVSGIRIVTEYAQAA